MDDIIENARALAGMISQHERFVDLRALENRILADSERRDLVARYEQVALTLRAKDDRGLPVTDPEREELSALKARVHGDPELLALSRSQARYRELLEAVNTAIHETLDAQFREE